MNLLFNMEVLKKYGIKIEGIKYSLHYIEALNYIYLICLSCIDGLLPSIQCIKKLCFDDKVCLSISSTDDNKSLEMLYDIADEGKEKKK